MAFKFAMEALPKPAFTHPKHSSSNKAKRYRASAWAVGGAERVRGTSLGRKGGKPA
ncbi:hypothetical protein ACQ1Q1_03205 [Ornithobacterium rhinotracheale]|uniref:hypothetical protein n=1 Tax=Ornithobacterium rhinotracheale TaxID=28251 RepID=UPI0012E051C8|nr:hypothetical protein [Ornithobacterium rhinotracheale]MCK0195196.1 hypothetical protein [Ornithobacterium rhinotracheale]MCK0203667.1 hypothetical protein [Ornithobacterium rhinotracheale]UOH62555.1 hypothetical protein MT993_05860 [Ornithobacterium rhinotracheale]UOH65238.1 hypothetical protein MT999_08550 [Ornithobacterium rhinotracheale]